MEIPSTIREKEVPLTTQLGFRKHYAAENGFSQRIER
jgi:hypothetical protein